MEKPCNGGINPSPLVLFMLILSQIQVIVTTGMYCMENGGKTVAFVTLKYSIFLIAING